MFYVTAAYLYVAQPEVTAAFLSDALGFQCEQREGLGWWVENGSVCLLLREGTGPSVLNVHCNDVGIDVAVLISDSRVSLLDDEPTQHGNCVSQRLLTSCGLQLIMSRLLDEDEMQELLPLPTSLSWDVQVDLMVRRLLRIVPVDFRQKARVRVTERAECLAVEQGLLAVDEPQAIQALIDSTLDFQQRTLYEQMQKEGLAVNKYFTTVPA